MKSILAAYGQETSLVAFVLHLVLAGACAWLLGRIFIRYGRSLSLGLVGALSIVRFRAPIKEPEELTYLFITICLGLGFGAGLARITLVGFALVIAAILMKAAGGPGEAGGAIFLTIL